MTTAQRFYLPIPQIFTDLGTLAPGWKLYFYQTGTTKLLAVYSDVNLTVPLPNPVLTNNDGHLVDGSGNITSIYYVDSALYKAVLEDQNNITQWTADPCDPFTVSIDTLSPRPMFYAGTTTGTSAAYILNAAPPFLSYSNTDTFELTFHTACAANPTLQYGTNLPVVNLKKQTGQASKVALLPGDVNGTHLVRNDGIDIIVLDPLYPFLNGNNITQSTGRITIANNISSPNNNIDFSAGNFQFSDSTGFTSLFAVTKILNINWVVGNNQGGLDTGSKTNSTWYHCYTIYNPTSNIADAIFSLSPTSPLLPSGYTKYHYVNSVRTDSSGNILGFNQNGRITEFTNPSTDITGSVTTSRGIYALKTPAGIVTKSRARYCIDAPGAVSAVRISSIYEADAAVNAAASNSPQFTFETATNNTFVSQCVTLDVITDTSSSIAARSTTTLTFYITTLGWEMLN
jgi:hypothetical protein